MKKEFKGPGKGSGRRPEDFKKLQKNWDAINWGNTHTNNNYKKSKKKLN